MTSTSKTAGEPFQEGADARAKGGALDDNPYCIRTDDHMEWVAGWHAMLDLDEDDDPTSLRVGALGDDPVT